MICISPTNRKHVDASDYSMYVWTLKPIYSATWISPNNKRQHDFFSALFRYWGNVLSHWITMKSWLTFFKLEIEFNRHKRNHFKCIIWIFEILQVHACDFYKFSCRKMHFSNVINCDFQQPLSLLFEIETFFLLNSHKFRLIIVALFIVQKCRNLLLNILNGNEIDLESFAIGIFISYFLWFSRVLIFSYLANAYI